MSRFEGRWRECLRAARRAPARPLPGLPSDVAIFVRRMASVPESDDRELAAWWRWYGARGLAVAMVILAGCVVLVLRDGGTAPTLRPGVEDAVAEVLWRL